MGSIYEYSLQYKPGEGRVVPEFIMVHEIIPYCNYTKTHFGYAESGCSSKGTIEYSNKESFSSRIIQINNLEPYTKNVGTIEEPNYIPWTEQELSNFIDQTWNKTQTLNAILDSGNIVDYYFNDYEIQHFYANIGLNDDTREVVSVQPTSKPAFDIYWPDKPELINGKWKQKWAGREFTAYELTQYREQKKLKINDERTAELNGGFYSETFDKRIDSDEVSRSNIMVQAQQCIISIAKGEPSFNIVWRVEDDSFVTVTRDEFLQMNDGLAYFTETVYQSSWDRKAAVDLATTRLEIDGI